MRVMLKPDLASRHLWTQSDVPNLQQRRTRWLHRKADHPCSVLNGGAPVGCMSTCLSWASRLAAA